MSTKIVLFLKEFKNEILLSSLFLFPLLAINYIGFLGVFVSVLLIIFNFKEEKSIIQKRSVLLSISFYLILIVSLIYSKNISEGIKEIVKGLLIAVFPFSIILFTKIKKTFFNKLLLLFIIANILLCFYVFGLAIEILAYKKMVFLREANFIEKIITFVKTPYRVPFNWSSRNFEVYLFFHKAYVSLSLCLSALTGVYFLLYKKNKVIKTVLLLLAVALITYFIYYMQSVPNIIGFIVGVLILVINLLKGKTYLLIGAVLLILVSSFFFKNKIVNLSNKLTEVIESDYRKDIWFCALDSTKSDLILGHGIGDQEDIMLDCYKSKINEQPAYKKIYEEKMNPHNQFITFVISGGIFCLLAFLFLIIDNTFKAIRTNDVLFLAFISLILINFFFESIIDRVYGVFLFSLFNSFFIKRNITLNN